MNSTQIECALALAKTLNFSKASEIVHMSQPSFSKTIASLEEEVGVQLFIRNKRSVYPTSAGESILAALTQIDRLYGQAIEDATNIKNGVLGTLRVGFYGTGLFRSLPRLLDEYKNANRKITVKLKDCTHIDFSDQFLGEEVDLLFVPGFQMAHFHEVESLRLFTDDMCVAVNREHPLASRTEVSARELWNESFIVMGKNSSLRDYDFVAQMCTEAGFVPKIDYEAHILHNIFLLVECNIGVSIFARHLKQFANDHIVFVPITEYRGYFEMHAVWRKGQNPSVPEFVQMLTKVLEGPDVHGYR